MNTWVKRGPLAASTTFFFIVSDGFLNEILNN